MGGLGFDTLRLHHTKVNYALLLGVQYYKNRTGFSSQKGRHWWQLILSVVVHYSKGSNCAAVWTWLGSSFSWFVSWLPFFSHGVGYEEERNKWQFWPQLELVSSFYSCIQQSVVRIQHRILLSAYEGPSACSGHPIRIQKWSIWVVGTCFPVLQLHGHHNLSISVYFLLWTEDRSTFWILSAKPATGTIFILS